MWRHFTLLSDIVTEYERKSTSANTILHAKSGHPRHLVNNIPTGQYLRARRICSNTLDFEKQAEDLQVKRRTTKQDSDTVRFITTYHSRTQDMNTAIAKYWPLLTTDQVRGIDRVYAGPRGGNWKTLLAQKECKWIEILGTKTPAGLNEINSFASYLVYNTSCSSFYQYGGRLPFFFLFSPPFPCSPSLCTIRYIFNVFIIVAITSSVVQLTICGWFMYVFSYNIDLSFLNYV
ncbi:uncharacterized protein LOC130273075 isoform X2 [Hyla sarda]|uniref:uncharacterized protein LOC130273075 isoform X2 n=1 Tax=Hyla sarda TaxID=327740 RepID=UPI0024C3AEB1|nr:uncharacterized protein LOC130273075 isoform X2 [Hyla sarda]XP_056375254.1 uncharacterized protein LOC130273075 isoform X2 [Hyla sarda]